MKINKKDLDRFIWYEDRDGNIIEDDGSMKKDDELTYHSCFPLEITEYMYSLKWMPETLLQKHLWRIKPFRKIMEKKHKNDIQFHEMLRTNTHIGGGNQELIMAMVNSGDYTLNQALMLLANSCERCENVLAYKYLNGKDGYAEYSDEWKKCNTVCAFCKGDEDDKL